LQRLDGQRFGIELTCLFGHFFLLNLFKFLNELPVLVLFDEGSVGARIMVLALAMFSIFLEVPFIFGAVGLDENPFSVLHVVLELAAVALAVFVEVLSSAMLFVFTPIADVEFAADIVVLTLAVLHAVEELPFVPLPVFVDERPLAL
jgi:hypothetical protein